MFNFSLTWDEYKSAFEWDGSLRDIYVLETTVGDWNKFLNFISTREFEFKYLVGEVETELPLDVAELLARNDSGSLLSIDLNGAVANCHFFWDKDIELDLDPREIKSDAQAAIVFNFMARLGYVLGKDVILTGENTPTEIWFRYNIQTQEIEFHNPL